MVLFNSSEVVEMGIQIERNGLSFYTALADKSEDNKIKDLFRFLAREEEKHIVAFQNVLSKVERYEPSESYPGEYFAYLNALASEYVFTQKDKGEQIAEEIKSDKEAVEFAIGFEKDSIIFYEGMKTVVFENEHKVINELIKQEQEHLKKLVDLKKTL